MFIPFNAGILESSGSFIWTYPNEIGIYDTFAIWQGWWLGAFFQGVVLNGAIFFLAGPVVVKWKSRLGFIREWQTPTTKDIAIIFGLTFLVLAAFILGTNLLSTLNLQANLRAITDLGLSAAITNSIKGLTFIHWISLAFLLLTAFFGYQIAINWTGSLRNIVAVQTNELREAKEKYHSIFSQARNAIVLIDGKNGQIVDCNPEFEKQSGRNLDVLKTMKIWEIRPPDKIEGANKTFFKIWQKEFGALLELEFQKPDGEIVHVEFLSRRVTIRGSQYTQSIFREITEKVRAEDRIQHLQSVLMAIRNVNQLIVREKNQQKLLQGACKILNQTRDFKLVWIGLIQEGTKDVLPAAQAGFEEGYLKSIRITWDEFETGFMTNWGRC